MTTTQQTRTGWIADASTFGARLALVRQKRGWGNVQEAARACGVPTESWRNWERDGMDPRHKEVICARIADAAGCDYLWLMLGPLDVDGRPPAGAHRTATLQQPPIVRQPLGERVIKPAGQLVGGEYVGQLGAARPGHRLLAH